MAAIPEGYRPRTHVMEWRREAIRWLESTYRRADAHRIRLRLIDYLARMDDPRTRTLYVTWSSTATALQISRATVARLYAELREAGLLVTVARGRSAAHTPRATGRTQNEAPVYALTVAGDLTSADKESTPDTSPVGTNETPVPVGRLKEHLRAGARESAPKSSRFAAGISSWQRATRAAYAHLYAHRPGHSWSLHATMKPGTRQGPKRAQKQVIWELSLNVQTHILRARDASTAAVAAEIRPFILAGWNVGDISHALTYSPSGSQHWHSDSGFFRAETWMRYRLAEWMRDGMPIRSESQRRESERAEAEARRRAEAAETAARRRRQAVQAQSPVGPGRSKVRAMLAQRRRLNG